MGRTWVLSSSFKVHARILAFLLALSMVFSQITLMPALERPAAQPQRVRTYEPPGNSPSKKSRAVRSAEAAAGGDTRAPARPSDCGATRCPGGIRQTFTSIRKLFPWPGKNYTVICQRLPLAGHSPGLFGG
jgi:hypothetical protein